MAGLAVLLNCHREGGSSRTLDSAANSATHPVTNVVAGNGRSLNATDGRNARFDSVLPANAREALYALAPDFSPYRRDQFGPEFARMDSASGPYGLTVVRADLNADSVVDIALLGSGRVLSYFIALVSKPDGTYEAMHVEPPVPLTTKDTLGRGISIERQRRGRVDLYVQAVLGRYITLPSDGVVLDIGMEGGILFFLKGGKFVSVGIGD